MKIGLFARQSDPSPERRFAAAVREGLALRSDDDARARYLEELESVTQSLAATGTSHARALSTLTDVARFYRPLVAFEFLRQVFPHTFDTRSGDLLRWSGGDPRVRLSTSHYTPPRVSNPAEFGPAMLRLQDFTREWNLLPGRLTTRVATSASPQAAVDRIITLQAELVARGLSLEHAKEKDFPGGFRQDHGWGAAGGCATEETLLLSRLESRRFLATTSGVTRELYGDLRVATRVFRQRLESLKLPPGRAAAVVESWSTVGERSRVAPRRSAEQRLDELTAQLADKLRAVEDYAARFGREELVRVLDLFDLHHFDRLSPDRIHDQVVSWEAEDRPVTRLVIVAHSDHNDAFGADGPGASRQQNLEQTLRLLEDEWPVARDGMTVVAEVGTQDPDQPLSVDAQIARIRRQVIDREFRRGGTPQVEILVYVSHMDPDGMYFGPGNRKVGVSDYQGREFNGAFGPPLGPWMETVLLGCAPAGNRAWATLLSAFQPSMRHGRQKNIAGLVGRSAHRTHAAPVVNFGIIGVAGKNVQYGGRNGPVPAVVIPGGQYGRDPRGR